MPGPERGISLTAGELACEGVDTVLDAIANTGATAVGIPTGMVVEATANEGSREPPLDVDGEKRRLDRPLWGKRALYVQRLPVHDADANLWRDLPWEPPVAAPDDIRVDYPRQAIDAARARNLLVYANFSAYSLPGAPAGQDSAGTGDLREEFRPQRLTGGPAPRAIAVTGCLNHPDVRALGRARLRELLRHYGDVDGLSVDWPEYPAYFVEELFTCFCDHCRAAAERHGHDWDLICQGVRGLWDSAHTLNQDRIREVGASGDWGALLIDPISVQAGINAWLDFKAHSAARALQDLRDTMRTEGAGHLLLSANGFAFPWGRMSGSDYAIVGNVADSVRHKLYSFHWRMMVRWWTETLLSWNRESTITPEEMTAAVLAIFGMARQDSSMAPTPELFGMPGPDDHHGLTANSYTDRLENALARRELQTPYLPFLHGYRSVDDFAELLETVRPFTNEGVWVQRYGYLRDEKLALLRQEWNRPG